MPNIDLDIIPCQMGFLKGLLCPAYAPLIVQVLTCAFHVGMKSSIVGRTGSGKTTLNQTVFCLVEPTASRQILLIKGVKKEVPKVGNYKTKIIKESWNDLPAKLLELVISSLFLGDCIRFRLTCKSLISITPPMRSNQPLTQCESRCQHIPWLMSLPKNKSAEGIFYYPIYEKCATCCKTAYPLEKVSATVVIHLNELYASFYLASGLVLSPDAKPRLKWTPELLEHFIRAVKHLGGADRATRKTIMKLIGIPGLTLYHLKSHLQGQSNTGNNKVGFMGAEAGDRMCDASGALMTVSQTNKSLEISEALEMQIEVQRRLNEHL
ncbi:hypothetical protein IFM89_035018 [Coptis chinensis]|uniref:Uncharacterized protein n=1 Tax=Coptis chinensis TaxID=261450 RepID=A0A835HSB5_9MAGN|nr:hypothetical protein IFM89_035018 [Coptis chinensis]